MKRLLLPALVSAIGFVAACSATQAPEEEGGGAAFSDKQLRGGSLPDKTISLTYDDGPGPRTIELSAFLKSEGIAAAFFFQGNNAGSKSAVANEVLKKVQADGHLIASHSFDHPLLTKLSPAAIKDQIARTDKVIGPFQTGKMRLFRAPFGGWSPAIGTELNKTEFKDYVGSIFWDIGGDLTATHAADWACWGKAKISVADCGARYVREAEERGKGIVLMHDIHSNTVEMTKVIVPILKAKGFKFVRVDQVPAIHDAIMEGNPLAEPAVRVSATPTAVDLSGGLTALSGPSATACKTKADDGTVENRKNYIYCGGDIGIEAAAGKPETLYRCTDGTAHLVCPCAADKPIDCGDGRWNYGAQCSCEDAEPGAVADCDPNWASCL